MKKIYSLLVLIGLLAGVMAQTVTIPTNGLLVDSVLYETSYNNVATGAWTTPEKSNGNTSYTINTSIWQPTETELTLINANGGTVTDFLMVLKIPISLVSTTPSALDDFPDRKIYDDGTALRQIRYWFSEGYANTGITYIYFYTQTHKSTRLTGAQILTIVGLSGSAELLNVTDTEFTDVQAD